MPEKHFDDGLAFLVNTLRDASRSGRNDSYDVYIPDIAREFMRAGAPRVNLSERPDYRREHENMKLHALPLYDAAWELCRRGILRPSPVCPAGQANSSFTGEGYSLNNLGAHGLKGAWEQLIIPENPSRFASLLSAYVDRYGPGFAQRASEAHNCYITTNYLS